MNHDAISEHAACDPNIKSQLVRRLLRSRNDQVKHRVRRWLTAMEDEQLLCLGLNARDRAALRTTREERLK
jgi:hypothetical protein